MERGTDRELAAVRREWRALDRERRSTTRLLFGLTLAFAGVVALLALAGLPLEACVRASGLRAVRCSTADPEAVGRTLLLAAGVGALGAGLLLSAESVGALRTLRENGARR